MAKTVANLIKEYVKRSKLSLDDLKTIKSALDNTALSSIEVDETEYNSMLSNIHSLESADSQLRPKIEGTVKKAVLDGAESLIETIWGEGLSEEDLSVLKSTNGFAQKSRKAFDLQKSNLEKKLNIAKKSGDSNRELVLEKEIEDLNKNFKAKEDSFNKKIEEIMANHKKELFGVKLKQRITSKENIADEFKSHRYFAENFGKDLELFLQNNKIEINPETEELLNSETKTKFFDKQQTERDLNWVLDSVVKEFGYEKKSIVPPKGTVEIKPDTFGTLAGAAQMLIQENSKL